MGPGTPTRRFLPQESLLLTFSMDPWPQAFGRKCWRRNREIGVGPVWEEGEISFAFGMGNAYDFRKVERRSGSSVQFSGFIRKKYLLWVGLSVAGMILFAVFGGRGIMQIYQLKEERNRIQESNARLQEDNRKLAEKISRLRNSKEEVEKVAREELGLVKKGEIVYQFDK